MQSEWQACTLGDFVRLQRGHDLTADEQRPGKVPVMGSAGQNGSHTEWKARGPGVVIGRSGASIGRVHYSPVDYWPHNTCLYVTDFLGNDPRFAYYLLQTLDLAGYNSGSAQPSLNRNYIYGMPLRVPSRFEQGRIVEVLQGLDDRIDLLRQTNTTLESVAKALFKSWFIDFEPVRAKAEGRDPDGMSREIAALFPFGFEESALGLVPAGWKPRAIEELAEKVGMGPFGSNIKVSTFVECGIPVLNGSCLKDTLLEEVGCKFITEQHAERLAGSLVRAGDIVITHRGTLGQVSLIASDSEYPNYMLSQSQFYLRTNSKETTPEFMSYFLMSPAGQHLLLANAAQVGVPSISRPVTYLKSIRLAVPSIQVARAFADLVAPLHRRVILGRRQIRVLGELRDNLLPRLISGKLRLPEVEDQLNEALA
ncbi:restriction endonuclease subunit S [Burkholderia pseudomallei]|uniref:restriction endonuclease subunit S n=1 Tax=Burkholderia pseudomallei TaxID=28450 RepID=UPI0009B1E0D4